MSKEKQPKEAVDNGLYTLLPTVIDDVVKRLSQIKIDFMNTKMQAKDFNEISEQITDLKEYLINSDSYNGR